MIAECVTGGDFQDSWHGMVPWRSRCAVRVEACEDATATQELVVVQNAPWPGHGDVARSRRQSSTNCGSSQRCLAGVSAAMHRRNCPGDPTKTQYRSVRTAGIVQVISRYFFMAPTRTNRTFQAHAEVHLAPECRCPLSSAREDRGVGAWLLANTLDMMNAQHERISKHL